MTCPEAMARLEKFGNATVRAMNKRNGADDHQFGCKMGDIRALAKEIKLNPELAEELWATGNLDARFLATLLMKPKQLTLEDLDRLLLDANFGHLVDWLATNVVKQHPKKEERREAWMNSDDPMTARMGWSLTAERVNKNPEGLDVKALLDRIEAEMGSAPEASKWTMNYALYMIGVEFAEHRARAIAIGERIGAYKDYPTSKGCVSPYAPICIPEMASRLGK